jgi:hypothetical protein
MFSSLLASLTTLRDFLSRAFFLATFLPTLLFVFLNSLILYIWSWPFHEWVESEVLDATGIKRTVLFTALFLFVWIAAYVVASLTPIWTRTLEGQNWPTWLGEPGKQYHLARYQEISEAINEVVEIYARIEHRRTVWQQQIDAAVQSAAAGVLSGSPPSPTARTIIRELMKSKLANKIIQLSDLQRLYDTYINEIKACGFTSQVESLSPDVKLLEDYTHDRAVSEHSRLLNERNMEFGGPESIAPTRFGNVGQTAQAYAMRAYRCNLTKIWNPLRQAAVKDAEASKAFENCKSQLDFLVASFWLSLALAIEWALIFTVYGEWQGSILAALLGPLICWLFWYGAAVEQYRLLQDFIISVLNSLRFQVLTDLHCGLPADLLEERDLWRAIDFAIGNGEALGLRYQSPKPS